MKADHEQQYKDQSRSDNYAKEFLLDWEARKKEVMVDPDDFFPRLSPQKKAVIEKMGDVRNKNILEFGCGNGLYAVYLSKLGAKVVGIDLGRRMICLARRAAELNQTECRMLVGNIISLPFPSGIFDYVIGHGILHHLPPSWLKEAVQEAYRVLKATGKAYFSEPVENSRIFDGLQNIIPINSPLSPQKRPSILQRKKWRQYRSTIDDRSLTNRELLAAKGCFTKTTIDYYGFLIRLGRLYSADGFVRILNGLDRIVTSKFSPLKKLSQCVLICYSKPEPSLSGTSLTGGGPDLSSREPRFFQLEPERLSVCHITAVHSRYDVRIFHKECLSLKNSGYRVSLIVSDGLGFEICNTVAIHDVFYKKLHRIWRMILNHFRILKKAMEINADLYHFHDPELIPIGLKLKASGKMVIYDVHEDMPRDILSKSWIPGFMRRVVSLAFERYEHSRSQYLDYIITATPFINRRLIRYNEQTVNINNFPILPTLRNSEPKPPTNQICYIGFISPIRGLRTLLDSLSFCEARLILAGTFSDVTFETELRNHPNWAQVTYIGYAGRETVQNILSECRIGLVPFQPIIYHLKALPTKMFEYMAAGLPVIASAFPYWIELLGPHDCAVFVDPTEPERIGAAIADLMNHPEKSERIGCNGRQAVHSFFNWETEERKLLAVYRSAERARIGHYETAQE